MPLNEQEILRRTQTLSAPSRRALSTGLQNAILGTRYQENPNVAALVTRQALRGYGEGLSRAISTAEQTALNYGLGEERLAIERENLGLTREQIENQQDANTISGITQLGLLGLTGYDIYNKAKTSTALASRLITPSTTAIGANQALSPIGTSNVSSVANDMAISAIGSETALSGGLTAGEVALQTGAPATLAQNPAAYSAISGIGTEGAAGTGAVAGSAASSAATVSPAMAGGIISAAILAAPLLGPTVTSWGRDTFGSPQEAPAPSNYLSVLEGTSSGEGWDADAERQLDNLLGGYAENPSAYTGKPVQQVQEWLAMQKYGQWQAEEGSSQTYRQWRNQIPLSDAQALLDQYKQAKGIA